MTLYVERDADYIQGGDDDMERPLTETAERLKRVRKGLGLSQPEMAVWLAALPWPVQYHPQTISDWERGKHDPPTLLNYALDELLRDKGLDPADY